MARQKSFVESASVAHGPSSTERGSPLPSLYLCNWRRSDRRWTVGGVYTCCLTSRLAAAPEAANQLPWRAGRLSPRSVGICVRRRRQQKRTCTAAASWRTRTSRRQRRRGEATTGGHRFGRGLRLNKHMDTLIRSTFVSAVCSLEPARKLGAHFRGVATQDDRGQAKPSVTARSTLPLRT